MRQQMQVTPVLIGVALAVIGWLLGQRAAKEAFDNAVDSSIRAEVALIALARADSTIERLTQERDSALAVADGLKAFRLSAETQARRTVAGISPRPVEQPDTCLTWIARADSFESAATTALSGLEAAGKESLALRTAVEKCDSATKAATVAIEAAKPVLEEHATVKRPGLNLGGKLVKLLTPVASLRYGANAWAEGGRIRTYVGASASVGWQLNFSLGTLLHAN